MLASTSGSDNVDMDIRAEIISGLVELSDTLEQHLHERDETSSFPPMSGAVLDYSRNNLLRHGG